MLPHDLSGGSLRKDRKQCLRALKVQVLGITVGAQPSNDVAFVIFQRDIQALIGRSILTDVMVVDVSRKNIAPYTLSERSAAAGAAR